jgi:hypothetical protein
MEIDIPLSPSKGFRMTASYRTRTWLFVIVALAVTLLPTLAEDWTTNDGKTYRGITVLRDDSVSVTILYADGGATINLADLPSDIQKKYGFDPKAAAALKAHQDSQAAADLKAQQDAEAVAAKLKVQQDAKAAADLKAQQDAKAAADAARAKQEVDLASQESALTHKAKADYDSGNKATVNGQIFIVTQGGDNIKLGMIHVYLFSGDQIDASLSVLAAKADYEEKKLKPTLDAEEAAESQAEKAEAKAFLDSLQTDKDVNPIMIASDLVDKKKTLDDSLSKYKATVDKYSYYTSPDFYAGGLPTTPITSSESDADGKFTMQIPKTGTWVLAAKGQRSVGDKTEGYFWLVKVSSDPIANNQIFLNNENLAGSNSPDSMIRKNVDSGNTDSK